MSATDLTFLYGESVPRCTHHIDKVFADYSTLQYMSAGGVELAVDGEIHQLRGPWFWSAYPGPRIRFHVAPGHRTWRHRYIAFRGKLIDRWRKGGLFPIAPQRPPQGADYAEPFDALLRNAMRSDRWSKLRAINLLEGMLIDLAEARTHASTRDAWLERTIARLQASIAQPDAQPPNYATVAAESAMSERTLRRRFRAATGMPPHEYLLHARIAEARRLLGETNLPTKTIAAALGYRDVYFFSRQFRHLAGVPPAAYRRSRQS